MKTVVAFDKQTQSQYTLKGVVIKETETEIWFEYSILACRVIKKTDIITLL